MIVTRHLQINESNELVVCSDIFSIDFGNVPEMKQWLIDNNIDYEVEFVGISLWHFKILTKSEKQKANLMWFKLKWPIE